ncbi:MAG TPA: DUF4097 family beta strand repeat-containing protein [Candidatus Acidoferrales bacterium]|nr:DUF4097 family beta strand repeat-containing protein [Candidatus Acidoferrales bacterium]
MRNRTLTLVLFILLAAPAAFADNWSKTWNVSASPDVRLVTGRGTITINQVAGNSVRAVVNTSYWRITPSEVEITESQTGNSVRVQIRTPEEHNSWFHFHSPKVEIELDVPARSNLDLETGFGDVSASGLQAKSRFNTGFGHVRMSNYDGALDAQSGFGDLTTDGRFDSLILKTGFGHINAEASHGSHLADAWRLSSGFGDLRLRLADDLNADVHASTGFGGVSSDYPITISGMRERSSISGRIGSGGPPLELETGFGSVHISKI